VCVEHSVIVALRVATDRVQGHPLVTARSFDRSINAPARRDLRKCLATLRGVADEADVKRTVEVRHIESVEVLAQRRTPLTASENVEKVREPHDRRG
jgi:uncharacterized protein with FMN-binding domain